MTEGGRRGTFDASENVEEGPTKTDMSDWMTIVMLIRQKNFGRKTTNARFSCYTSAHVSQFWLNINQVRLRLCPLDLKQIT